MGFPPACLTQMLMGETTRKEVVKFGEVVSASSRPYELQLKNQTFVGGEGEVGQGDGATALHVGGQGDGGLFA